jgi:hypothetical protein
MTFEEQVRVNRALNSLNQAASELQKEKSSSTSRNPRVIASLVDIESLVDNARQILVSLSPDDTATSKLSNRDLRKRLLDLADQARDLQSRISTANTTALSAQRDEMRQATEEERSRIWNRHTDADSERRNLRHQEFSQLRPEAILLRDEALKRLPPQPHELLVALDHGTLAGPKPVGEVAEYLERLAKLLIVP